MAKHRFSGLHAPNHINMVFDDNGGRRAGSFCGLPLWLKLEETNPESVERRRMITDCPKCAAQWGKAELAKLGERVRLEKREPWAGFIRSNYAVIVDGVERGLIVNEYGFGKGFELRAMPQTADSEYWPNVSGERIATYQAEFKRPNPVADYDFWPVHFAAREAMAIAAFHLALKGGLPTTAEAVEKAAKRAEARAAREASEEAEREARRAARLERDGKAKAALASLRSRADISTAEREGLDILAAAYGLEESMQ